MARALRHPPRARATATETFGNVNGLTATITASCDSPCSASGSVSGAVVAGTTFTGTLDFTDTTKAVV